MKLLEIKDNIVRINIDTDVIRKFNRPKLKTKIDCGDYNEFLIVKIKNGNQEAIMKSIEIIKKLLLETGCSTYEQLKARGDNSALR